MSPKPTNTDSELEQNALDNMGSVSNTETRKPTNTDGRVPDAAVEALAAIRWREQTGEGWEGDDGPLPGDRELMLSTCRRHLAAALPSLEDSFKERVREALEGLDRFVVGTGSSGGHYEERTVGQMILMNEENARGERGQWIRRADALAALDSEDHRG